MVGASSGGGPTIRYSRSAVPMRRKPAGASAVMAFAGVRCERCVASLCRRGGGRNGRELERNARRYDPSRNLKRWIFPVAVFGKASTTSTQRGYFQAPILCLTCSLSASCSPPVSAPARSTTNAFGLSNPSASASGTTAASSTAGCVINALSTSNGDTQTPDTLNMSSLRPQNVYRPSASRTYLSPVGVECPWKVWRLLVG